MRAQVALLALSLAISLACASTTVRAEYDAAGRLRACEVHAADVARVSTATCSEEALTVHHAPESGWFSTALGALGGWLAARVGL